MQVLMHSRNQEGESKKTAFCGHCRTALWDLLERWGCGLALLKVLKMLHGGTSYQVRVHGGLSDPFVMERVFGKVVLVAPFFSTSTMLGANLSDQIPGGPNPTLTLTLNSN